MFNCVYDKCLIFYLFCNLMIFKCFCIKCMRMVNVFFGEVFVMVIFVSGIKEKTC